MKSEDSNSMILRKRHRSENNEHEREGEIFKLYKMTILKTVPTRSSIQVIIPNININIIILQIIASDNLKLGSNELLMTEFPKDPETEPRVVPKSTKPESCCLLITNLQRPFSNSALNELLNKDGKFKRFWMDMVKSHCYVEVCKIYFNNSRILFLIISLAVYNKPLM